MTIIRISVVVSKYIIFGSGSRNLPNLDPDPSLFTRLNYQLPKNCDKYFFFNLFFWKKFVRKKIMTPEESSDLRRWNCCLSVKSFFLFLFVRVQSTNLRTDLQQWLQYNCNNLYLIHCLLLANIEYILIWFKSDIGRLFETNNNFILVVWRKKITVKMLNSWLILNANTYKRQFLKNLWYKFLKKSPILL